MFRLILISGPSGSGKTTLGTLLSAKLGYNLIDQDSFYKRDKPKVQLTNGEIVSNWDSEESLDLIKFKDSIIQFLKVGNLIVTGFALRDNWVPQHIPKIHFHLNIGDNLEDKCIKGRKGNKPLTHNFLRRDPLIVKELVIPFYLETLKYSTIDHQILVYEGDKRMDPKVLIDQILTFLT